MAIYNHVDISMKYAFATLGKFIHSFFKLDGEYKYSIGNEVITYQKRNLRMDIAYFNSKNIINNIETQTKIVDEKKLEIIAEYAKFLLINNEALVNSIIITKVDPKYCAKEIALTETLFLRPLYIYHNKEKILKLLNIITDKINNKKKLTYDESIALAIIPTLAQDCIAEEVTIKVCKLISKYKFDDPTLKRNICFVVDIMVDRNIKSESKRKQFLEMLNMEDEKEFLKSFIKRELKEEHELYKEQLKNEYKKEIEDMNNEIELMKKLLDEQGKQKEIDYMRKQLEKKDQLTIKTILNNDNIDENTKKNILSSLMLI